MFAPRWMIGHTTTIIEYFYFGRFSRQYGQTHDMPKGKTLYAREHAKRSMWGPLIDYEFALDQIDGMDY